METKKEMTIGELAEIMSKSFDKLYKYVDGKIDELRSDIREINERLDVIETRLDKIEQRLDIIEGKIRKIEFGHHEQRISTLEDQMKKVSEKIDI